MTNVFTLLMFVAVVGLGLGLAVWRLSRAPSAGALPGDWREFVGSSLETYQPLSRLFAEEDFTFLAAQRSAPPEARKLLRRQRIGVLRLYLRQLRAEFRRVHLVCRLLAQHSADPGFAPLVARQAVVFYSLMSALEIRCALGFLLPIQVDAQELVAAFERLRQAAGAALPSPALEPLSA